MITRHRSGLHAGALFRAAGMLAMPLMLAGCITDYSLRDRIAALSVRDHNGVRLERRAQPYRAGARGGERDTVASRIARWQAVPPDHKRTPYVNSPEWLKEQAEAAKKDRELDLRIRSICRGC